MRSTYTIGEYRTSEGAAVMLPRRTLAGKRGILGGGGAGTTSKGWEAVPLAKTFTDCGLHMIVADMGTPAGLTWGNDNSMSAMDALWTYAKSASGGRFPATDKVLMWAGSMHTITMLNWAMRNPTQVAAMALQIPLLDLDHIYQANSLGFRASVGTAYGVTYPTTLPGLATHSPIAYSPTDLAKLAGIPITLWCSSNDTIAAPTSQAQTWAASVGSNVTVIDMGALGHSTNNTDASLIDFLKQYA